MLWLNRLLEFRFCAKSKLGWIRKGYFSGDGINREQEMCLLDMRLAPFSSSNVKCIYGEHLQTCLVFQKFCTYSNQNTQQWIKPVHKININKNPRVSSKIDTPCLSKLSTFLLKFQVLEVQNFRLWWNISSSTFTFCDHPKLTFC